jgi:Protein of unknown function (DUF1329)
MRWLLLVLALVPPLVCQPASAAPVVLHDGDLLGPNNWEAARGLLPDEILAHYRNGEYENRIMTLGRPGQKSIDYPPDFQAATRANRGRFALASDGHIVDATTGKQPRYVMGLPFPDIDTSDPQAGAKIVWNYFYATWYAGNSHYLTQLEMLDRSGVQRQISVDVRTKMYDGTPAASGIDNPKNLLEQRLATVTDPADLSGTVSLTWRYRDPAHQDSQWVYVPELRRPREVSPLNRSDGFLGSDITLDDGPYFDAKPESFTFHLVGRADQLVLVDPYSVRGQAKLVPISGGGWRTIWKNVPRIGAEDSTWKGLPWAPVSAVLARRPVWIVEAVPKDRNYLYGKIVLRFDADTYHGSWSSKYDRSGALVGSYQVSTGAYYSPDGRTYVQSGGVAIQIAENLIYHRATVILLPKADPDSHSDERVPLSPELFSLDALVHLGE